MHYAIKRSMPALTVARTITTPSSHMVITIITHHHTSSHMVVITIITHHHHTHLRVPGHVEVLPHGGGVVQDLRQLRIVLHHLKNVRWVDRSISVSGAGGGGIGSRSLRSLSRQPPWACMPALGRYVRRAWIHLSSMQDDEPLGGGGSNGRGRGRTLSRPRPRQ